MGSSNSLIGLIESRTALQKVLEEYEKGRNIILIAPTGYGKTILSLKLIEVARSHGFSNGLIHVVPYRALVREIYSEKFKGNYSSVGYQSLDEIGGDKSPYYLRELVVTTLDSFIYNLYKLPVSEMYKILRGARTLGHYYPVLASIFTSTIVFDEAHVYLGSELASGESNEFETLSFMLGALNFLVRMNQPLVIETATMHTSIVAEIVDKLRYEGKDSVIVYVGGENAQIKNLRGKGFNLFAVKDETFEEKHGFPWKTVFETRDNVFKYVEDICESEAVLVIHNSIKRAVEAYNELSRKCSNAVLLHSLMSNKDRERALVKIMNEISGRKGVIVSTQVVEAGVDAGARILVTEPAPVENLAQRAGRLCREKFEEVFKRCREESAEIYIVKDDPEKVAEVYSKTRVSRTMELISKATSNNKDAVNWRLLSVERPYLSFTEIIEEVSTEFPKEILHSSSYDFAKAYLESDAQPDVLIEILNDLGGGLVRSSILVNVLIPQHSGDKTGELEFVTVDFARLVRREISADSKCLDYVVENDKYYLKILLQAIIDGRLKLIEHKVKDDLKTLSGILRNQRFKQVINILTGVGKELPDNVKGVTGSFLVARRDCYTRGEGFAIW